jgi:cob(I)alamin adenosyltransferase
MKIYTKTGDAGITSLLSKHHQKVPKSHELVECVGDLDELNTHLGNIISQNGLTIVHHGCVTKTQSIIFDIGSCVAGYTGIDAKSFNAFLEAEVLFLEQLIDEMTAELPTLREFILPGGNTLSAAIHMGRAVCRRAERSIVRAKISQSSVLKYINRLSDYLFTLGRYALLGTPARRRENYLDKVKLQG